MSKADICCSPHEDACRNLVSTHGKGDDRRHIVGFQVHDGPATAMDRRVKLILDSHEALVLASLLIGALPTEVFADPAMDADVRRLLRFAKMIEAARTEQEKEATALLEVLGVKKRDAEGTAIVPVDVTYRSIPDPMQDEKGKQPQSHPSAYEEKP